MPFVLKVCENNPKKVKHKNLPQKKVEKADTFYYKIGDIAVHASGTTNLTNREFPRTKTKKSTLLDIPELRFYKPKG